MRCPSCTNICSELRDICPHCKTDLRAYKKENGLPVSYPELSYQEILERSGVKDLAPNPESKAGPGFYSFLGKLFSSIEPEKVASDSKVETKATISCESTATQTPIEPEHKTDRYELTRPNTGEPIGLEAEKSATTDTKIFSFIDSDEEISSALDRIIGDSYLINRKTEIKPAPPPTVETIPMQLDLHDNAFDIQNEKESLPEKEIAPKDLPITQVADTPPLTVAPITQNTAPLTAAIQSSTGAITATQNSERSIDQLFADAELEIIHNPGSTTLELGIAQFNPKIKTEEYELLFDMAYEALENPEVEKVFAKEIVKSETKKVESEALMQQLEKVQERISAPILTLKATKTTTSKSTAQPLHQDTPISASCAHRVCAYVVDLCVIVFCFLIFLSSYIVIIDRSLRQKIFGLSALDFIEKLDLATGLIIPFLIFLVCYPLICFFLFDSMPGLLLFRLVLLRNDNRAVTSKHVICRCLSFPLSCLFLGFTPMFFGKQPLHDYLARTKICFK